MSGVVVASARPASLAGCALIFNDANEIKAFAKSHAKEPRARSVRSSVIHGETMSNRCDGCRRSFSKIDFGPMLRDEVWRQLAAEWETLCYDCILSRAAERQVDLSLESLEPCSFNLFHWPKSYFNLFKSTERQPLEPKILSRWRAVASSVPHIPPEAF
jgi:hypothetical protein